MQKIIMPVIELVYTLLLIVVIVFTRIISVYILQVQFVVMILHPIIAADNFL